MTTISELKGGKTGDGAELRQTAKLTAREAGGGSVARYFESQKTKIASVLPSHLKPARMLRIALSALRTTPKLQNATTETLFGAVVTLAQLGLEPNTPLGHAYLIPFDNKREGVTEVQIVIGYKGLIELARRSGQILSIAAHAVYEKDTFIYEYGLEEKLSHKPVPGDRGKLIYFYAFAKLRDGGYAFEVMTAEDVNAIRDASNNYKFARDKGATIWGKHYDEMGRKTVLRRLFKYLPVSIEMMSAAEIDGGAESIPAGTDVSDIIDGQFRVVDEDAPGYEAPAIEQSEPVTLEQQEPQQQAEPEPVAQAQTRQRRSME